MDYKGLKANIIFRLSLILLTIYILVSLVVDKAFFLTIFLVVIILGVEIITLFRFFDKTYNSLQTFLNNLKKSDLAESYPTNTDNELQNQLNRDYNEIVDAFKVKTTGRKETSDEFQYLKNIVQLASIGLLTFNKKGEVQIINMAAKRLLKSSNLNNIEELRKISPQMVDVFYELKTGGKELFKLEYDGEINQISVYAIELNLRGEVFKLISLQNIQVELEEKEMEAWQNLVRVLTHEIMNSVTPISSLAHTVADELQSQLDNERELNEITNEEIEDLHTAVQTIQKRSAGLIRFVQDFRSLTHIPTPNFATVKVKDLVDQIVLLMKKELADNKVTLETSISETNMEILADKGLIEQVLINLIKNAIQAFDEDALNKKVELSAFYYEGEKVAIRIQDNGPGIDEEALEKIFIPFFTTKKNGSGIGLSLSRQIMRKHQGVMVVQSKVDEGTEFELRF